MPSVRSFTVLPSLPEKLKELDNIARNLFWSWNPEFSSLFKRVDSNLWESCGHNPVKLLGSVSQETLDALAENQGFLCELKRASDKMEQYMKSPTWYECSHQKTDEPLVAYFSAEFGIHESLPLYSGGLGVLAGDHLKSASDLGIPLVAVGLCYQKGYFRQYLNIDGWQQEIYADNDFYNMPISPALDENEHEVKITIDYPGSTVTAKVWCLTVGRIKAYLLDTNLPENAPEDRLITANLYGGDLEMRIRQEIMLGIGGLRALAVLGIKPKVCHMNEGHAAFLALERIRQLISENDMSFDEALEASKGGNAFTVHTPVKAGNDEFPPDLILRYFNSYITDLGIDKNKFLSLGRFDDDDEKAPFKMPVLAIRLSSFRNGVSKLHGKVSRRMWSGLWPQVPISEVPITSITNGVHIKTWLSPEMDALYDRYLGVNWTNETIDDSIWKNITEIPDEELWRTHQRCKAHLISFARRRLKSQMQRRGTYHTELNWAEEVLDPEALTIGFARRFATYKRGNLLFRDAQRIMKILSNTDRPLQIIFAGKAHPRDTEGKEIIRQIIHFANQHNVRRRIVFLEDYDINVARYLVQGVDIWLNNPRPPLEASGTSGMKAAFNGALNVSTWDGWWCEGYAPQAGWVIGSGETYEDAAYQDMVESESMYNLLENEIIPLFYTRATDGIPRGWIHRMKHAIKRVTPMFNTHRMVSEYNERFYMPAADRWNDLTTDSLAKARELSAWQKNIHKAWKSISIKDVLVGTQCNGDGFVELKKTQTSLRVGAKLAIRTLVSIGDTNPDDVSIELYHGRVDSWGSIVEGESLKLKLSGDGQTKGEYWFEGLMPCTTSGRQGMVVRVLPANENLVNPHEPGLILWESGQFSSN